MKHLPQPSLWCIRAVSLTFGTLWGLTLLLAALFEMKGAQLMWFNSEVFAGLKSIYPGLDPSMGGAFYGLVVGLICGLVCGALIVLCHNFYLQKFYCGKR